LIPWIRFLGSLKVYQFWLCPSNRVVVSAPQAGNRLFKRFKNSGSPSGGFNPEIDPENMYGYWLFCRIYPAPLKKRDDRKLTQKKEKITSDFS
jgi:hypothetical protein